MLYIQVKERLRPGMREWKRDTEMDLTERVKTCVIHAIKLTRILPMLPSTAAVVVMTRNTIDIAGCLVMKL